MTRSGQFLNLITLSAFISLLAGCGSSGGIGNMSLKPHHTDNSNGFALTLTPKQVDQTILELQNGGNGRQGYSSRLSDQ